MTIVQERKRAGLGCVCDEVQPGGLGYRHNKQFLTAHIGHKVDYGRI